MSTAAATDPYGTAHLSIDDAAKHSASLEATAEAVMHARTLLVDLDRRQNQTREGIRALRSQQEAQHRKMRLAEEENNKNVLENAFAVRQRINALIGMPAMASTDAYARQAAATSSSSSNGNNNNGASSSNNASKNANISAPNTFVNPQPMWLLCSGGVFVRTNQARAYDKLLKTQHETHEQIEETRHELKTLVAELARLEGVDSALARANAGFELPRSI